MKGWNVNQTGRTRVDGIVSKDTEQSVFVLVVLNTSLSLD